MTTTNYKLDTGSTESERSSTERITLVDPGEGRSFSIHPVASPGMVEMRLLGRYGAELDSETIVVDDYHLSLEDLEQVFNSYAHTLINRTHNTARVLGNYTYGVIN